MAFLDKYKIDKKHAEEGVRFELDEGNFIVMAYAGASNRLWASSLQDATNKIMGSGARTRKLTIEEDRRLLSKVYARCIVKDWGGPDFNGTPCTHEEIEKIFTEYPEFFSDMQRIAGESNHFLEEYIDGTIKNS